MHGNGTAFLRQQWRRRWRRAGTGRLRGQPVHGLDGRCLVPVRERLAVAPGNPHPHDRHAAGQRRSGLPGTRRNADGDAVLHGKPGFRARLAAQQHGLRRAGAGDGQFVDFDAARLSEPRLSTSRLRLLQAPGDNRRAGSCSSRKASSAHSEHAERGHVAGVPGHPGPRVLDQPERSRAAGPRIPPELRIESPCLRQLHDLGGWHR